MIARQNQRSSSGEWWLIGDTAELQQILPSSSDRSIRVWAAVDRIEADDAISPPALILLHTAAHPAEACSYLRAKYEDVPLLAVVDTMQARTAVLTAGATDTLLLPLHPQEVAARLQPYTAGETARPREHGDNPQTGFVMLLARRLAEINDADRIADLVLSHLLDFLPAHRAELWLRGNDNHHRLKLTAEQNSTVALRRTVTARPITHGLLGHIVHTGHPLLLNRADEHTAYAPKQDDLPQERGAYAVLGVPLIHRDTIGVLLLINPPTHPFGRSDRQLLGSISSLTAAAIVNAWLVQKLRHYGNQRRILYEMSRQIGSGLDLDTILPRAFGWINSLCPLKIGVIWLLDDDAETFTAAAYYGISPRPDPPPHLSAQSPAGTDLERLIRRKLPIHYPHLPAEHPLATAVGDHAGPLHTMIAVPLLAQSELVGILTAFNRQGGPFRADDVPMLFTSAEIIAVAVHNAQLHAQTVALMSERERLYRQSLQSERLATVGRLTASLAHEINNPMQSIKGAMVLAGEDLDDDPTAVREYIDLSIAEADRVVRLIKRMRQIYRPAHEKQEAVNLVELLHEVMAIARKEMQRQNVSLQNHLPDELPRFTAVANQLHLLFLNFILHVAEALGKRGGGALRLTAETTADRIRVCLHIPADHLPPAVVQAVTGHRALPLESGFNLTFSQDILHSYDGTLTAESDEKQLTITVELPL